MAKLSNCLRVGLDSQRSQVSSCGKRWASAAGSSPDRSCAQRSNFGLISTRIIAADQPSSHCLPQHRWDARPLHGDLPLTPTMIDAARRLRELNHISTSGTTPFDTRYEEQVSTDLHRPQNGVQREWAAGRNGCQGNTTRLVGPPEPCGWLSSHPRRSAGVLLAQREASLLSMRHPA